MPRRRHKKSPTPWQIAKPFIVEVFGEPMRERGFSNPGTTMWRYRGDFVDVVNLSSKYGNECYVWLGCNPRNLGDPQPKEWNCIFRTGLRDTFRFPTDEAEIRDFVKASLTPRVIEIVDEWFPKFSSIDQAIWLLKNETAGVSIGNKDSPAWQYDLDKLLHYVAKNP